MALLYVLLRNASDQWSSRVQRLLHAGFAAHVLSGLLGCAYLYVTAYAVDAPTVEQGQERAASLLVALEQYGASEGRCPPDLVSSLVDLS